MSKRDHISLTVKLAAALLMLRDENGELLIPHEHAKLMSADQIISLYQFDHYPIRKDDDGPDEPWNLEPKGIMRHRKKTAEIDVPQMAKADRLQGNATLHAAAMASKRGDYAGAAQILATAPKPKFKRKIASRGFQQGHRPLRSRGFERRA